MRDGRRLYEGTQVLSGGAAVPAAGRVVSGGSDAGEIIAGVRRPWSQRAGTTGSLLSV